MVTPLGRRVDGLPAVYETWVRPDAVHTSLVVGVAWMDAKLLTPALYSGSTIPGGGPFKHTAPVSPAAAKTLVAAFNSGFLMNNANGGYYTGGRTILPLRNGAASFVIYRDGTADIIAWDHGAAVPSDVVAVRQNLDLLVDHGKPIPGLNASDTTQMGFTLGNAVYVWRSGLGITADGCCVRRPEPVLRGLVVPRLHHDVSQDTGTGSRQAGPLNNLPPPAPVRQAPPGRHHVPARADVRGPWDRFRARRGLGRAAGLTPCRACAGP